MLSPTVSGEEQSMLKRQVIAFNLSGSYWVRFCTQHFISGAQCKWDGDGVWGGRGWESMLRAGSGSHCCLTWNQAQRHSSSRFKQAEPREEKVPRRMWKKANHRDDADDDSLLLWTLSTWQALLSVPHKHSLTPWDSPVKEATWAASFYQWVNWETELESPPPRDRYLERMWTLNSNPSPWPSPAAIINVKTVFERVFVFVKS